MLLRDHFAIFVPNRQFVIHRFLPIINSKRNREFVTVLKIQFNVTNRVEGKAN